MLDKYLCKKIHKKTITVADVWNYFLDNILPKILRVVCTTIIAIIVVGGYSCVMEISFWQGLKELVFYIITWIAILATLLTAFITFLCFCEKISKIKVAECPFSKEEEKE